MRQLTYHHLNNSYATCAIQKSISALTGERGSQNNCRATSSTVQTLSVPETLYQNTSEKLKTPRNLRRRLGWIKWRISFESNAHVD